jgi:hypothetical protein
MRGKSGLWLWISVLLLVAVASPLYPQFAGGTGTEDDPYLVGTPAQLSNVRNARTCFFLQIADIDLNVPPYNQGNGWTPICSSSSVSFYGTYDGGNHFIRNLFQNRQVMGSGLFGYTSGAHLKNILLAEANVSSTSVDVGLLLGSGVNTTIEYCMVTGSIFGMVRIGGLAGKCESCDISFCQTNCCLELESLYGGNFIGAAYNSTLSSCSSSGRVYQGSGMYKGGFIGYSQVNTISNCHSDTSIDGDGGAHSGGFVSHMYAGTVANCYYSGTSLNPDTNGCGFASIGYPPQITNSYWDTEASGTTVSAGGLGRTTDEMTYPYAANTYENWDFTNVWAADSINTVIGGYPYLRGFTDTGIVANPVFSHHSGYHSSPIMLTIVSYTPGATIHYTLDGSEPDEHSSVYTTPLYINGQTIVKTFAAKVNWVNSLTVTAGFCAHSFPGGSGTSYDPYLVTCPDDLYSVRYFLDAHFKQTTDIDMNVTPYNTGSGWEPIAAWNVYDDVFSGNYDGDGFQIANLFIDRNSGYSGLFGAIWLGVVKNINLSNVNITGGYDGTGGLAGCCDDATVSRCSVSGDITGFYAGGLIGSVSDSQVSNCYSTAAVTSEHAGGLVSYLAQSTMTNCYSRGPVYSTDNGLVGGLIAEIGNNSPVIHSYWDVQTSGTINSAGGEGRTTDEMTYPYAANTYVNWDLNWVWHSDADYINDGYPYLYYNRTVSPPIIDHTTPEPGLPVTVWMQCSTWGAVIYYTLNGSEPDENSRLYEQPFFVEANEDSTATIRARAFRDGFTPSYISSVTVHWDTIVFDDEDVLAVTEPYCKVYPNPFNPETTISFNMPEPGDVRLGVFNSRGQKVKVLADTRYPSGDHSIGWDGRDSSGKALGSGVYFYRLETGKHKLTGKMILLK